MCASTNGLCTPLQACRESRISRRATARWNFVELPFRREWHTPRESHDRAATQSLIYSLDLPISPRSPLVMSPGREAPQRPERPERPNGQEKPHPKNRNDRKNRASVSHRPDVLTQRLGTLLITCAQTATVASAHQTLLSSHTATAATAASQNRTNTGPSLTTPTQRQQNWNGQRPRQHAGSKIDAHVFWVFI